MENKINKTHKMKNKINKTHGNKSRKNHNDKGLKTLAMMTKKLEPKSAMKTNEECQSGSDTMWRKMVKKFLLNQLLQSQFISYIYREIKENK